MKKYRIACTINILKKMFIKIIAILIDTKLGFLVFDLYLCSVIIIIVYIVLYYLLIYLPEFCIKNLLHMNFS